jgi:hypothetical protein
MALSSSQRNGDVATFCLLVAFCVFWFSDTVADPDLWGHVRFGQDILRTGSIIQDDVYSYRTSGQSWFNHEWLSEVIFAGIYEVAGPRGLIGFKVLLSLAIVGLCHRHLRRCGLGPLSSATLLLLISIPFRLGLATIRPQVFTYLLFLLELLLIDAAARGRRGGLWISPFLFAAWTNLHGGVLAGVGVLGLWAAARTFESVLEPNVRPMQRVAAFVRPLLLGSACGLALPVFLFRTGTVPRPEITEWAPLSLTSLPGLLYLGLLAIGVLGLVGSRRRRDPAAVLTFSVIALLPLAANRHYPLFAMALVVLVGEHIADAMARLAGSQPSRLLPRRAVSTICVIVAVLLIGASPPRFHCIRVEPFYFPYPARAVALLKRSGFRGNAAVPFDWGEYVIWHLGPAVKVSIDGRRETVYSDETYRQSRDLARGTDAWDALLKTPPATDLVMAPNGSPTVNLLARTNGWRPLYQDTYCTIFSRDGLPDLERIVRTPVPALRDNGEGECFLDPNPASRASRPP